MLQPDVIEAFRRACVPYDTSIGVIAKERVYLDQDGGAGQRIRLQQILTSWSTRADGSGSTVRQQLLPDVTARNAGYVAWRGLVGEADLTEKAVAILCERFL